MKLGCCLIIALLIKFPAAFPLHGNFSGDKKSLMMNGADKSATSFSMLSDDSSPGHQDGMDVGFVRNGLVNLTLIKNTLVFEHCDPPPRYGTAFGICYDAHSPDSAFIGTCSPSQCFLKIYGLSRFENTYWKFESSTPGCGTFYIKPSANQCIPKIENGMVQLNVLDYRCHVKAIDAQIKYPASTTAKPSQESGQHSDETASASLWYQKWWFILIIVCLCLALILGVVAAVLFFYLKKRKAVKPPSGPFADAPTIETLFKESERKQSLKPPSPPAQKKKSHMKKKAVRKERERPFLGGDDTISYLESQGVRLDTSSYYIRNKSI